MKKILEKIIEYSFYFFVFVFLWQTKLIIRPAETNYNEIAVYFNYALLLFILVLFIFYLLKYGGESFKNKFSFSKYWVALAGLEFFIFLSIFVSANRDISIFKYILFLVAIGLLFLMTNFKVNFKKVVYLFLLALLIQASLGFFQFFSQSTFSNKYLGLASHDPYILGVSVLENDAGRFVRAYGGLDHPNIFGALMFFGVIMVINLILRNNFSEDFKKIRKISYIKISHYFLLAIFLFALVISFSRSAFLALIISLLFYLLFSIFKKGDFRKKIVPVFIFSLSILILLFFIYKPLILDRFNFSSRLESISLSERTEQVSSSADIIKNNPQLGVGFGAYHQKLLDLNNNLEPYQAQPVHNVFILALAEIGLWGFILFILFLFYLLKINASHYHNCPIFIGFFVFMALDHWLWSLPFGLIFMFFILGLTFYFKCDIVNG